MLSAIVHKLTMRINSLKTRDLIRRRCLKSGENWFRFVEQPLSKYKSISIEALILRRRHKRFFQIFPKIAFSCFRLK